jgi:hypothetical protein
VKLRHSLLIFAVASGLIGAGPRVGEAPTITGHPFISPYEDLTLKAR